MPAFKDLQGMRFGKLVVECKDKKTGQGWNWRCRCDCGNYKSYPSNALNRGKAKSCGCIKDVIKIDQIFGNLTVTYRIDKNLISRSKSQAWECKCTCGSKVICTTSELNSDRKVSCGCMTKRSKAKYKEIWGSFWNGKIYCAKQRGISFSVSIEEAWDLYEKQNALCALSGIPIGFGRQYMVNETTASLDRIDSSKGYTLNNIQWVHKRVNQMKNNMTTEEFQNWCTLIHKHLS